MARAINALAGGSVITWAIFREGSAEKWVRRDLETLLAPYRARCAGAATPQRPTPNAQSTPNHQRPKPPS
jgi:hypothetical protein